MGCFGFVIWVLGWGVVFGYFGEADKDCAAEYCEWEGVGYGIFAWIYVAAHGLVALLLLASFLLDNTPGARAARAEREKQEAEEKAHEERRLAAAALEREKQEREQAAERARVLEVLAHQHEQRRIMADLHARELRQRSRSVREELRANRSIAFRVFQRDDYRCRHCGSDGTEPGRDLTVDHMLPVSRGGTNELANLQTLCRSCNSRKGTRIN